MNISSAVVKTTPEHLQEVLHTLHAVDQCEIHFHDKQGRIVVTIEGESISEEMETLKTIQALPHVLSADLAYAYSEKELADAIRHVEKRKDAVPGALKDSE